VHCRLQLVAFVVRPVYILRPLYCVRKPRYDTTASMISLVTTVRVDGARSCPAQLHHHLLLQSFTVVPVNHTSRSLHLVATPSSA